MQVALLERAPACSEGGCRRRLTTGPRGAALATLAVMALYDPPLDPGISAAVLVLRAAGIETFESCQGGPGHSYPEPAVRFHGEPAEGFRALAVAMQHALPVHALRRVWRMENGEPVGPWWELTFVPTATPRAIELPTDPGR